jgi:hypothetical protein
MPVGGRHHAAADALLFVIGGLFWRSSHAVFRLTRGR